MVERRRREREDHERLGGHVHAEGELALAPLCRRVRHGPERHRVATDAGAVASGEVVVALDAVAVDDRRAEGDGPLAHIV